MKFECEKCNYLTNKKGNYDKHLTTKKHLLSYNCVTCNKQYTTKSGLWKHKETCASLTNNNVCELLLKQKEENSKFQEDLLNQIKQQQQQLTEMIPKLGNSKINIKSLNEPLYNQTFFLHTHL